MSALPTQAAHSEDIPIRDAACVVVVDSSGSEPKLLMGRRHADQVFLPDKWVFPGGRVDDDDRALAATFAGAFAPQDLAVEIRPFALAAVRELSEETGLVIGRRELFSALAHTGWREFASTGHAPAPAQLVPLARAITPPGRVRRYDTWFFMALRQAIADTALVGDGELLDLNWFTITDTRRLDLPNITKLVLEDAVARLGISSDSMGDDLPFYYADACGFQRTLISCKTTPSAP